LAHRPRFETQQAKLTCPTGNQLIDFSATVVSARPLRIRDHAREAIDFACWFSGIASIIPPHMPSILQKFRLIISVFRLHEGAFGQIFVTDAPCNDEPSLSGN